MTAPGTPAPVPGVERLRCHLCGHLATDDDHVSPDVWTGYPVCRSFPRCRARRFGKSVPVRIAPVRVRCGCCREPLPDGLQHVRVMSGEVAHWSHELCGPGCREWEDRPPAGLGPAHRPPMEVT